MRLADRTFTDLLDAFRSPDPTPGGGSASALAGAMAAALLEMVTGMTKTANGTPADREALDAAKARIVALRTQLVELADQDSAAYDQVVASYKLPKATDDEKAARKSAIQRAMRVATEVPLETMRATAEIVGLAATVKAHGNPNASSDAEVGRALAAAAREGARRNVEINLGSLTDQALVQRIKDEVTSLG